MSDQVEDTASETEEIITKPGESFSIKLPGYGISGYVWRSREPRGPVMLLQRDEEPAKGTGGTQEETLSFSSEEPGTYELWRDSMRPWEGTPRESRHYRILVK